ncbi:hypothetical protein O0V02_09235 [Gordonia amicalis]|uniref:hypothetical protein n=1 Tax=Gordonia amicalis TaxID=89053 RepID=UPI0022A728A7|nr:hypothetical protein [Gordonia amicalis]MCZ0912591.1 hypothetical protein [Gordonia amicalis]
MRPDSLDIDQLVYDAIRLDIASLRRSKVAGAAHFAGVFSFEPKHLNYRSSISQTFRQPDRLETDSTALFSTAEALRLVLSGERDNAISLLKSLQNQYDQPSEQLLLQLMTTWISGDPGAISVANQLALTQEDNLPLDVRARIQLQLMTWSTSLIGNQDAAEFYDQALSYARGDLRKAIQSIGNDFGRDSVLFLRSPRSRLVKNQSMLDLSLFGAQETLRRAAKKRVESPHVRHIGAVPQSLPDDIVAAELQAEWSGSYWTLKSVWRQKANAIVAVSNDPDEISSAIADWILSDQTGLNSVIDSFENHLTANRVHTLLHDRLLSGRRVRNHKWIEVCGCLSNLLPDSIASGLANTIPLRGSSTDIQVDPQLDKNTDLFARILANDPASWESRFLALPGETQAAVSERIRAMHAPLLSEEVGRIVCDLIVTTESDQKRLAGQSALTAAWLIENNVNCRPLRSEFMDRISPDSSALVALNHPSLKRQDLIQSFQDDLIGQIQSEIEHNRSGRWSGFARSLPLQLAQTMIALETPTRHAIEVIQQLIDARLTSADTLQDALKALLWLLDENIIQPSNEPWVGQVQFRDSESAPVSMWSGRDDVRAINALVAGIRLRTGDEAYDAATRLSFAARDPDIAVRLVAVESLQTSTASPRWREGKAAPILDAVALGAVFDPDSRVQSIGIRLIPSIEDAGIATLSWARTVNEWQRTHTRSRVAAVKSAFEMGRQSDIAELAGSDRSVNVRRAYEFWSNGELLGKQPRR